MSTNPQGAVKSAPLTEYAFQIQADFRAIEQECEFIAPKVTTGAKKGEFSIYDTKQSFVEYDTARAIGGPRRRIKHAGSTGTYNNRAQGLEVALDGQEVESDESRPLQAQAKTRQLMSNWYTARMSRTWAKGITSGNYTASTVANSGKWSDANVDPIKVLDDELVLFANRTGRRPNRGIMALDNWVTLRNHPLVIKRQPGAANIGISLAQLSAMLAAPIEFRLDDTYVGTTGFGSSTDVKQAKVKGYCMLFLSSQVATTDDPSWMKTTSRVASGFSAVMEYFEPQSNSTVYYLEDEQDIIVASPLCGQLIAIT